MTADAQLLSWGPLGDVVLWGDRNTGESVPHPKGQPCLWGCIHKGRCSDFSKAGGDSDFQM